MELSEGGAPICHSQKPDYVKLSMLRLIVFITI